MEKSVKMAPALSGGTSASLYEELSFTFHCIRIFGLAPFAVIDGKLKPSKKFGVHNFIFIGLIFYCSYAVCLRNEYDVSTSVLSVLMYKLIGTSRMIHVAVCLSHFWFRTSLFLKMWSLTQEINTNLESVNIHIDVAKCRKNNLLATVAFLVLVLIFFTLYCTTIQLSLSPCFWLITIVPPFYSVLLIFLFCVLTNVLRHRLTLVNAFLREELQTHKIRLSAEVKVLWRIEWKNKESDRVAMKFRMLKIVYLNVYKTVKYLNKLFGFHFLFIFLLYFCIGTLHSFTVIRYFTGQTSQTFLVVSACAVAGETVQIALAIHGAIALEKEVHLTLMLVHRFLTVVNEYDINLENELQSFAIQLSQCRVRFSAAGLFTMDYTKLLQFGVAFFSNAVFFLQVDDIQKAGNMENNTTLQMQN